VKQQIESKLTTEIGPYRIKSQATLARNANRNAESQRILGSFKTQDEVKVVESPLRENKGYMNSMAILRNAQSKESFESINKSSHQSP